ncbi:hypothetical protein FP026_24010 [Rhizobium tropici]|uniref:Uncharacterized protein n=1 Tax=Rhizobium tropici TaxID=398 RepID=A0A5B0VU96_RHITR|nr:hypothetical protein [Rhizobium tropici]KAA1178262.1 hypothetical protein FP026_24010 [Rhizobium tropici]
MEGIGQGWENRLIGRFDLCERANWATTAADTLRLGSYGDGIGDGRLIRARFIGAVIKVPSGPLPFNKQEACQFSQN